MLKYTHNDESQDQFINEVQPYGWGDFVAVRGSYFPRAWDVESAFGQVNGNVNAYLSAGRRVTLALRAGGKKLWGTYPYMEAAAIGEGGLGSGALVEPENTVRGFRARRFLGDSSAWANVELFRQQ